MFSDAMRQDVFDVSKYLSNDCISVVSKRDEAMYCDVSSACEY